MSSALPAVQDPSPATQPSPGGALPPKKKRGLLARIAIRSLRIALLIAILLTLLVAGLTIWILWFFPNGLATTVAVDGAKRYGFELGIGTLDVRPLEQVTIENLSLDLPTNKHAGLPPMITIKRLHVAWNLHDALDKKAHLTGIEVDEPRVHLVQTGDTWNWQRAMAELTANPLQTATPVPVATPPVTLDEQLRAQSEQIDQMLSQLPLQADIDRIEVRGAGIDVKTDFGTIATVDGVGVDLALHLPKGGGATATLDVLKDPGIVVAIQPSADAGFSGTIRPEVHVAMDLPKKVTFDVDTKIDEGMLVAAGVDLPVLVAVKASGTVDVPAGDVKIVVAKLDLDHFLDATGGLEILALGSKGIRARWTTAIDGANLPGDLNTQLATALSAKSLHAGAKLSGSIDGTLMSTDVAVLQRELDHGRFPLTLLLKSEGRSDADPIDAKGVRIGGLEHRATVKITPAKVEVDSEATIAGIRMAQVLGGSPFSVHLVDRVSVPASLDAIDLGTVLVQIPEHGIRIEGHGRVAGLRSALAAYHEKSKDAPVPATFASMERTALAALTALSEIRLAGGFDFESKEDLEVALGTTIHGGIHAKASLTRGKDPFGRLKAEMVYDDFGARVANTSKIAGATSKAMEKKLATQPKILGTAAAFVKGATAAAKANATGEDAPPAEPAPLLLIKGMSATLTVDRELILGGHPKLREAAIGEDEAAVFDPATRGYYDRLGSLRADADNFKIDEVIAGPLRIQQLSAEVLYDGEAVHINRGRMQLLGGEVVGRMIIRPTSAGVHFAMAGDASGIDMSPLLLDHPVADPNDTRIHMSSAASFFLSKDDPIASLADAHARMDMTCAGSKVVDTVLAWLDPENKDPMYNWARSIDKKVVGITRPQISSVADRGMYDVTIAFPSLGLSKDVRRIPLAPMLALKFTKEMIGGFAPPGEMLPLLAARGIDADGVFLLPPVPKDPE